MIHTLNHKFFRHADDFPFVVLSREVNHKKESDKLREDIITDFKMSDRHLLPFCAGWCPQVCQKTYPKYVMHLFYHRFKDV